MRIAVFHNLPSGGAKRVLFEQTKWLSKSHEIDLYCFNISEEKMFSLENFCHKAFKYSVIDFRKYGSLKPFIKYIQLIQIILLSKKIAQKIDSKNYDLVFLHPCQIIQAPIILRYIKTKKIYYAHEPFREVYERFSEENVTFKERTNRIILFFYKQIRKYLDRISIKKADLILCNSKFTQKNLKKIYNVSASVIYPGIDIKKFIPIFHKKINAVLSVGRLNVAKGHGFVIRILSKIPREKRPKFFIVADSGNASDENRLTKFAKKNKVDLKIFKQISEARIVQLYNSVKAVICAQINEPLGLVPLEAQACGVPVLAVKEGGFLETIKDNKTGVLFPRDLEEAKKAIMKIENKNFAKKLIKNGLAEVKKWNWQVAGQRLNDYIIEISEQ